MNFNITAKKMEAVAENTLYVEEEKESRETRI